MGVDRPTARGFTSPFTPKKRSVDSSKPLNSQRPLFGISIWGGTTVLCGPPRTSHTVQRGCRTRTSSGKTPLSTAASLTSGSACAGWVAYGYIDLYLGESHLRRTQQLCGLSDPWTSSVRHLLRQCRHDRCPLAPRSLTRYTPVCSRVLSVASQSQTR